MIETDCSTRESPSTSPITLFSVCEYISNVLIDYLNLKNNKYTKSMQCTQCTQHENKPTEYTGFTENELTYILNDEFKHDIENQYQSINEPNIKDTNFYKYYIKTQMEARDNLYDDIYNSNTEFLEFGDLDDDGDFGDINENEWDKAQRFTKYNTGPISSEPILGRIFSIS